MQDGKQYMYVVDKVSGRPGVKKGQVILYRQAKGPRHFEMVIETKTFKIHSFGLRYLGPCWVKNDKVVKGQELLKPLKQKRTAKT